MPELHGLPQAWHYARALVEACRATGEDPITVAEGARPSRAAVVAHHALRRVFPRAAHALIHGRLGGGAFTKSASAKLGNSLKHDWWQPALVVKVVAAIRAQGPIALEAAPEPQAPPAPAKPPHPMRRVIDRRPVGNFTSSLMGDPPPARSALGQKGGA